MADTIEGMDQRLNALHAAQQAQAPGQGPVMMAPVGLAAAVSADPLQAKIDEYARNVPTLRVPEEFARLPDVGMDMTPVSTDFRDEKGIETIALILEHPVDVNTTVLMGRMALPMMSGSFSLRGAAAMLLLSYQLKDPTDGSYVLNGAEVISRTGDIPYADLSEASGAGGEIAGATNAEEEARFYAFVASATLRLFTKSEENFVKAWSHILTGYQRFYGASPPVTLPTPTTDAMKTLSHPFSCNPLFKSTLYRLLYVGGADQKAIGMRRFLYEMHIANTGMHAVGIFVRLCAVLNCQPGLLLTALNGREYARQVNALVNMLKLISSVETFHSRKMWKYGRLFDETFMSTLQTKSCPGLVYILASALKGESGRANQNILNIVQLTDIPQERKRSYTAIAEKIVKTIRRSAANEDN